MLDEAEADGSVWPPAIAALRLLMLTGCRKSEILTLAGNLWIAFFNAVRRLHNILILYVDICFSMLPD